VRRELAAATSSARARPAPALELSIRRVLELGPELAVVDDIARGSFTEGGFAIDEELARPWSRIWVASTRTDGASHANHVVAFLIAWHVADELHVLNVATAVPMRRRGVATAIMNEAIAYARQSRVRIVLLEVRRSNRAAIRLYRTLGFSAMGLRPNYYSNDGEDAVEMVISLDPATGAIVPGRDEVRIES
jgi:ribosomal-protein-alanine N-acetyltransferase